MWGRLSIAPGRFFELNDRHVGLLRGRFLIWEFHFLLPNPDLKARRNSTSSPPLRDQTSPISSTSSHIRTNHGSFSTSLYVSRALLLLQSPTVSSFPPLIPRICRCIAVRRLLPMLSAQRPLCPSTCVTLTPSHVT